MIIPIGKEKAFGKIQNLLLIKSNQPSRNRRKLLLFDKRLTYKSHSEYPV